MITHCRVCHLYRSEELRKLSPCSSASAVWPRRSTFADASYGIVRLLALLAARMNRTAYVDGDRGNRSRPAPLRDGRSADRLRVASRRTQILAATYSPTLVNRPHPEEIIDRDPETGASLIPAASADEIARAVQAFRLGSGGVLVLGLRPLCKNIATKLRNFR